MQAELWGERWVVHNYGHGGAGVTLAPGSAWLAAQELAERVPPGQPVAVLGAGIIGLSSALELQRRGYPVSVYAREFPPDTTSDVAGGVWAPVEVGHEDPFAEMLQRSYDAYRKQPPGVRPHSIYFDGQAVAQLEFIPPQLNLEPGPRFLTVASFLIQTSLYLDTLVQELTARGASLVRRSFTDLEQVLELPERAWVNCLGAGAGTLGADEALIPIRGQLVRMRPLEREFTVIHETGYIISRADVLLAGGTFERGVSDPRPQPEACRAIWERNRAWLLRFNQEAAGLG